MRRLGNFKGVFAHVWFDIMMTGDRLTFVPVEIDKNYILDSTPTEKLVSGVHVTSRNQGLSSNDQGRQRRESLATMLMQYLMSKGC